MKISDELILYIYRWEEVTGHKPTAVPITEYEKCLLVDEWKTFLRENEKATEEDVRFHVMEFCGTELFISENAKDIRSQLTTA